MIPEVIYYCWFGGTPLPPLAERCIASWRRFLPDYEIIRLDESNFNVNAIPYTAQAYAAGKYAFVSDYARFSILHDNGGLYFDTDVELLKPIDDIIATGPFMGCESDSQPLVNPGLVMGAEAGMDFYADMLKRYSELSFLDSNGNRNKETVVGITTSMLSERGLTVSDAIRTVVGINIYPKEYFCPTSFMNRRPDLTENTRTIHHYAGTWLDEIDRKAVSIGRYFSLLPEPARTEISYKIAAAILKVSKRHG